MDEVTLGSSRTAADSGCTVGGCCCSGSKVQLLGLSGGSLAGCLATVQSVWRLVTATTLNAASHAQFAHAATRSTLSPIRIVLRARLDDNTEAMPSTHRALDWLPSEHRRSATRPCSSPHVCSPYARRPGRAVESDGQRYLLHANFDVHACHNAIMPLRALSACSCSCSC